MPVVIKVENLSKRYLIGHQRQERYTTLRDVMAHKIRGIGQRIRHPLSPNRETVELEELWALKDINLKIEEGERVGIIGRNGAGKSTLLKVLSRITEPTTGSFLLNGRVASLLEVGTGFHPELTGKENIYLNGAILGMSKNEIKRKFDEIVAFAEVEKFLDTPVKRYSSGMRVRLAFSVAAHLEAEILIVDEVLAVGDIAFQKKCLGKMDRVSKSGRTVLFVSHSIPYIRKLCSLVYLLEKGSILECGATAPVVDMYYRLFLDKTKENNSLRQIKDGSVGYESWSIDSKDGDRYQCFTGDACCFRLKMAARRVVQIAHFGIAIWADDGTLVWAFGSHEHQDIYLNEGMYEVRFSAASLPLRPGEYDVLVSVNDRYEGALDSWYLEPKLTILERKENMLPPQWQGILKVDGRFELVPNSNPAGD